MTHQTPLCKACGMPMTKPEEFGTNADGSKNEEYCTYCMQNGKLVKFCQSCGMPMTKDEDFGTNADGSKTEEYCNWCYKDGKFTQDITMDEMIAQCADMDWGAGETGMTKEDKIALMKQMYPQLKRWQKAE